MPELISWSEADHQILQILWINYHYITFQQPLKPEQNIHFLP